MIYRCNGRRESWPEYRRAQTLDNHLRFVHVSATANAFRANHQQMTIKPWSKGAFGETNDRLLFQFKSEVRNEAGARQRLLVGIRPGDFDSIRKIRPRRRSDIAG